MMTRTSFLPLLAGALVAAISAMGGCGTNTNPDGYGGSGEDDASASASDDSGGGAGSSSGSSSDSGGFIVKVGDSSASAACTGTGELDCYVPKGCTTELTGTVRDPAGKNPIYNAIVFIPDSTTGKLPTITPGTSSCNTCDVSIGNYIAATLTDYKGNFTLKGVPATSHVPLVVQIGKWRREVFLPEVKACTNNVVAAADSRLPASRSEGDMPQMALLTGGADQLGCFLAGLGIASSEWTGPNGGGRLDVYSGVGGAGLSTTGTAGACAGATCPLWSSVASLGYYDIALLACEGSPIDRAAPAMQNMHDWLDNGGKVFATHYHYTWFSDGPSAGGCANCSDFVSTANWLGSSAGAQDNTFAIDTTFPKGAVLQQWLANLGLATGNNIALTGVASSVGTVNPTAQRWIYDNSTGKTANQTKYMTILTPIGGIPPKAVAADAGKGDAAPPESTGPQYCGKAVFSDLHAGSSGGILSFGGGGAVPGSCNTGAALTAQEAALEFLFFDLSACVTASPTPTIPPSMPPQ